jgi:class 3 adenylate cyclase
MNGRAANPIYGVTAHFSNSVHRIPEKRERPVAVMFADLEGCTRLCEELPPREMNGLIEKYFSHFFDAIEGAGGTVNEIMGDGFMALFDGESIQASVRSAARAAVTVQRQALELNAQRSPELDPVLVNIGIHAGTAFVGMTKFKTSSVERWTYTASGPVSNIGARLCAVASGGSILVSAEVAAHLEGGGYALESLGPLTLKNVSRPVLAFRLSDRDALAGEWAER